MGEQGRRGLGGEVTSLACQMVVGQIASGEIEDMDIAIEEAMPEVMKTAKAVYDAAKEHVP